MMNNTKNKGYNGNVKLRAANQKIELTKEQARQYMKCMDNPIYFIENFVKIITIDEGLTDIKLWKFQKKIIKTCHENSKVILKAGRQTGKALALNTPIPTPCGWKTMGDLKVGDTIFDENGNHTKVTFATDVMYDHQVFDVTFDNGETIKSDAEHLWEVVVDNEKRIFNTKELFELLPKQKKKGCVVHIPYSNHSVQYYSKSNLPIDPYLFGLWLGDDNFDSMRITCSKEDYNEYSKFFSNYKISEFKLDKRTKKTGYFTVYDQHSHLKNLNVLNNKHIPDCYLYSTEKERMELIRGLMDSDGSVAKNGSCEFYQKKKYLIDQVQQVFNSLGVKTRIENKVIKNQIYYTLSCTTDKFCLFKLSRKVERLTNVQGNHQLQNVYFESIKECDSVPVRCIQVDSPSHLFLCGKSFITTHNTTTLAVGYLLWYALFNHDKVIGILAQKEKTAKEILDRIKNAYINLPLWIQQGVSEWNKESIWLENGSKILSESTSSGAIRGFTISILYLDEFAFVPNNIAHDFLTSVYPTISSGKSAKIFVSSTPNGMNHFYKMVMDAKKAEKENYDGGFKLLENTWRDRPDRDEKWAEDQKRILGEEKFLQEMECVGKDTFVTVKNKKTGKIEKITIGELNERLRWKTALKIKEFNKNDEYEILTPDEWKNFDGIKVTTKNEYLTLHFDDGTKLECSKNHLLKVNDKFIEAQEIKIYDKIHHKQVIALYETRNKPIELYDPVNVGSSHEYIGNDLIHHNCEFVGSAGTLISSVALKNMVFMDALKELLDHKLKVYEEPLPDTPYIMTVDSSQGKELDYSAFTVFDVSKSPYKIVARYKNNNISAQDYPNLIAAMARYYNEAFVLGENNDVGSQVLDILTRELEYQNVFYSDTSATNQIVSFMGKIPGIRTTKKTKAQGCNALKTLIENGQMIIPDFDIISELTTFIVKKNKTYAAEEGCNDDLVMCLVLFAWLTTQTIFKDLLDQDMRKKLFDEKAKEIENQMRPLPAVMINDPAPPKIRMDGDIWDVVQTEGDIASDLWSGYPDSSGFNY